ncbi:MAG: pcaK [Alphaproteobacteria bacterium]|nr:pcaK [Alphaproteobacteria bacterium]
MAQTHDITALIDNARISMLQVRVVLICVVIGMLDGFDIQVVGVIAPTLAKAWQVPLVEFGPLFAAGLVGIAVGAFTLGPLGDRYGRKRTILISTFVFGLFSLLTAFASDVPEMIVARFFTGIGLGGVMPNIITLTAEYSPARARATTVTLMFCGLPLGLMLGALSGNSLIPIYGWQSVFVLGGVLPLLMLPLIWKAMPESIRFLVASGKEPERVLEVMRRIVPDAKLGPDDRFTVAEAPPKGFPVRLLFVGGMALNTALVWVSFFMNLLVMYFLVNWLPLLFVQLGLPASVAFQSTAAFNVGGMVGALLIGRLLDRSNPFPILAGAYVIAAIAIPAITHSAQTGHPLWLIAAVTVAGIGVMGVQIGMNAVTANIYPVSVRATGIGWALGVGRFGAIIGPMIGGLLLGLGMTSPQVILSTIIPIILAAIALILLGLRGRGGAMAG